MAVTEEQIIDTIKQCYDPEIPVDLWNLGLIYSLKIEENPDGKNSDINIVMTLTTPGCGMAMYMVQNVKDSVESLPGVKKANIEITFDPRWTPEMMTDEARIKLGFPNETRDESQPPCHVEE